MSEFIPQDLILKILSRLLPKSLIKFKCVSKSWNSLISSSYFVSLQTKHAATISKPTVLILIMHCFDTMYREIYPVYNYNNDEFSLHNTTTIKIPRRGVARFHYRMIMGSCNGVLCIYTGDDSIVLWNPVIRRRFALPMPQWEYKNVFVLGFGFDVERNDYKVVKLTHVREGILSIITPPKIEVYSLSARSWREINVEIPRHRVTRSLLNQVFVNRNVHWVAFRREEKRKNFIMAFDISLEVFSEISLPKPLVHWSKSILKPMVIEESLAVCQHKHKHTFCSIWIMKKYGDVESWSNLFNVSLARVYRIHGSGKNGDLLLTRRDQRLFSYNLETRERVDIGIPGMKDLFYVGSSVESLALMNEGEEAHGPFDTQSESD